LLRIGQGASPEEATRRLIQEHDPHDPEDGTIFWLAPAATQWQLGRLLPDVRDRALANINDGADLALWAADATPAAAAQAESEARSRKGRASVAALRAYLRAAARDGPVEVLHCWLGEEGRAPDRRVAATPEDFGGERFGFGRESVLYTVAAERITGR
jgi:hypothetical protein